MNWQPIVRLISAFLVYVVLVSAYLTGLSPLAFALLCAAVLCVGLWAHSLDRVATSSNPIENAAASGAVSPVIQSDSLTESVSQLHALQTEIDELQAQFVRDAKAYSKIISPRGSAS